MEPLAQHPRPSWFDAERPAHLLASPVYQHTPDPQTGNFDPVADLGVWIAAHVPGQHNYASPADCVYNHVSLGPGMLALALRFHWFCACWTRL